MKFYLAIILAATLSVADAELVKLEFEVKDNLGQPVKDATVRIRSKNKMRFPFDEPGYKRMTCSTDKNGHASERFLYWGNDICCAAEKSGYYTEILDGFKLKTHYDRETQITTVLEGERMIPIVLKRKISPIPLYSNRGSDRYISFGMDEITVGYDLKSFSAVAPYGKGETADFFIHHKVVDTNGTRTCFAELKFPTGGGAYVERREDGASHPIVYEAKTNAVYVSSFKRECPLDDSGYIRRMGGVILNGDETLVLRTRVVLDEKGDVVSANYSKIYGPLSIGQFLVYGQSCFNPTPNDTNLEFDIFNNLTGDSTGVYYP